MRVHGIRASVVSLALTVLLFASSASAATTIGQAPPTTGKASCVGPA